MDIFDVFPQKLRYYRKQKGLTQKQLGELLDLQPQSIIKYESSDRSIQVIPPGEKLQKLCEIFECKPSDLLEDNEDSFESKIRKAIERKVYVNESHIYFQGKDNTFDVEAHCEQLKKMNNQRYDNVPTELMYDLLSYDIQKDIESILKDEENRLTHNFRMKHDSDYAEACYREILDT